MTTDYPTTTHKDFTSTTNIPLDHLTHALRGAVKNDTPVSVMSAADRAEYLALLHGEQPAPISDDQADRILDSLWSIMVAFVDLGFPPFPIRGCGQERRKSPLKCDKRGRAMLSLPHPETDEKRTMHGSACSTGRKEES